MRIKFLNSNNKKSKLDEIIIDYINAKPEEFIHATITEISEKLYISNGIITKFAKKMNFKNLKSLQIYIAQEWAKIHNFNIVENPMTIEENINNIAAANLLTLESNASFINKSDISAAVMMLKSANTIFTFGIGSSRVAANILSYNLNFLEKNSYMINNIHDLVLNYKKTPRSKTIVFLLSNTLETPEILDVLAICEKYKIITIVVTSNTTRKKTPTTHIIRYNFLETSLSNSIKSTTPRVSQLFIVDVISNMMLQDIEVKGNEISREEIFNLYKKRK